ncbi:MAG TPA: hypothetical protein VMT18_06420 [Planctomycetota bacterium]|nr:hypothetical protein [Planctomycetota bacterium]
MPHSLAPRLALWIACSLLICASFARLPAKSARPPSVQPPAAASAPAITIDPRKELFIVHPGVVDDARAENLGPWSFGYLMTQLAGPVPAPVFVEAWLDTWGEDPNFVNGDQVFSPDKAASMCKFKQRWLGQDNYLDLANAPFRLLAIVNRPDLLEIDQGVVSSAGEARFIYGAFDPEDPTRTFSFFVIFEYGIPATSCSDLVGWHQRWHDLGSLALGSEEYNQALEDITNDFVLPSAQSTKPNGTLLNQLRTNEFELMVGSGSHPDCSTGLSADWDLREFGLTLDASGGHLLRNVTTKQTPQFKMLFCDNQGMPRRKLIHDFLKENAQAVLAGSHVVPETFHGKAFLAGRAQNHPNHPRPWNGNTCNDLSSPCDFLPLSGPPGTTWWAEPCYHCYDGSTGVSDVCSEDPEEDILVRHRFALQTCSGCHFQETGNSLANNPEVGGFSMVSERQKGEAAVLSRFLTGIAGVPDPVNPSVTRGFNDLANRKDILVRILEASCTTSGGEVNPLAIEELEQIDDEMGTRVH